MNFNQKMMNFKKKMDIYMTYVMWVIVVAVLLINLNENGARSMRNGIRHVEDAIIRCIKHVWTAYILPFLIRNGEIILQPFKDTIETMIYAHAKMGYAFIDDKHIPGCVKNMSADTLLNSNPNMPNWECTKQVLNSYKKV